jgi:hypothetical protein
MATCAEIVGKKLPVNAGEDSVSFLPFLKSSKQRTHRTLVHHSLWGKFAIRDGKWKMVFCPGSGGWSGGANSPAIQLYDMSADESERRNLQASHKDVVEKLTVKMKRIITDGRSTPGPKQKNDVPVDLGVSFPVSLDHTGDFDMTLNAEVKRHSMGYELSSPSIGCALHKLDKPITTSSAFEFRCRSLKKKNAQNALFVFGDSAEVNALIKCGLLVGANQLAIWHGTWEQWQSGGNRKIVLEPGKDYNVRVEIDMKKRIVRMQAADNELQWPLPQNIKEIRWYGYLVNGTSSAFSDARQTSLSDSFNSHLKNN